jgi:NTE family protein
MDRAKVGKLGLVMSGGGARSAYQAGVIQGLREIARAEGLSDVLRFPVLAGISAGAINAAFLACRAEDWDAAADGVWAQWERLTLERVLKADSFSLMSRASRLLAQLGLAGWTPSRPITELLDASPLAATLSGILDFRKVREHIAEGRLHGLGLTTTHYATGSSVTFFQGHRSIQPWMRSHRVGERTVLGVRHVLASSSIPMLFPPVRIRGSFYGDGAVRMPSPLSGAVHMGADRILAIGVRYFRTPQETFVMNRAARMGSIRIADIAGTLLNSIFLDALDSDLERMVRINHTLQLLPLEHRREHPESLRRIPVLAIRPSIDLAALAGDEIKRFSWMLRHLLKGLGAAETHGKDLLSYLAFETTYTTRLLELGRSDALARKTAILNWLSEDV